MKKDKKGLYYYGQFKTENYSDAVKLLYNIDTIPDGFCVDEGFQATGYSVVDGNGIQHIYELSPRKFYDNLLKLD